MNFRNIFSRISSLFARHRNLFSFSDAGSRRLWLWLLIISMAGMIDMPGANIFTFPLWLQYLAFILIASLKAAAITLLYKICRSRRWLRGICMVLIGGYIFLCLANCICFCFYGFGISHKMLLIIAQTNRNETLEFLPGLFGNISAAILSRRVPVILAAALGATCLMKYPGRRLMNGIICSSAIFGLISLCWLFVSLPKGRNNLLMSIRLPKTILEVRKENQEIERLKEGLTPLKDADKVRSDYKADLAMLIIGESASRNHLSIYGYPLPTSPGMEQMRDSLFIFSDAIGSSSSTAGNMERLLSLKEDRADDSWTRYPLLIDIFNAGGYKTFWLSNQERTGIWSNSSGVMASGADVMKYLGSMSSEDALLMRYDDVLLPEVEKALADTAQHKFVGVHLYGSHTRYVCRYPKERGHFSAADVIRRLPRPWLDKGKAQTVAEYDNSIRFTDSVVTSIFRMVDRINRPAFAIYIADHGENVYDDRDFLGRDREHVKVPFIIFANQAFLKRNPGFASRFREMKDAKISTANTPYLLLTLTGTYYPAYNASEDFMSPQFNQRRRYIDEEPE